MRTLYGKLLRQFFIEQVNPIKLIDLSDSEIFESATVLTNILIYRNEDFSDNLEAIRLIKNDYRKKLSLSILFQNNKILLKNLSSNSWAIQDNFKQKIKEKLSLLGIPLFKWNIEINIGILNGLNEAFVIDKKTRDEILVKEPKAKNIIFPMLRGRDMRKYFPDFADLYLINTFNGEFIKVADSNGKQKKVKVNQVKVYEDYPIVYEHLLRFKEKGETRHNKGDHWTNLRNCAYNNEFLKPKIIYPSITKDLPFLYDETGYFTNDKSFILVGENLKYLTCFLNSKLFRFCYMESFPELQGNVRELKKNIMVEIPVKRVSKEEQTVFNGLLDKNTNLKSLNEDTSLIEQQIDNLVYKLYDLTYEEVKIIDPEFSLSEQEYKALSIE